MRIQPRIIVNLGFFALLGIVLVIWAVNSIVRIDALERPFAVTAEFTDSPGLGPDLEVTHRGVRVGKVGDVTLRPGKVEVRLDLDRGVRVPGDVGARVLRKSAVGEPYVELTPGAGKAEPLKAGDHIPVARTKSSPEYGELFEGFGRTLSAVRPQDARILVHELAVGLEGRDQSIRDLIGDADRLTATISAEAGTLDELSVEMTRLTAVLSSRRGRIVSGVNDLALVTASLSNSRKELDEILARGPGRLADVNRLLEKARPGLGCLFTAAGHTKNPVFTPENQRQINGVLRRVPTFQALIDDVAVKDAQGNVYLRLKPVITLNAPAAAEYDKPVAAPKPVSFKPCAATPVGRGSAIPAEITKKAEDAPPAAAGRPDIGLRPVSGYEPERSLARRMLPLLPIIISAAVLLAVVARALRTARRLRHPH